MGIYTHTGTSDILGLNQVHRKFGFEADGVQLTSVCVRCTHAGSAGER